MKALLQSALNPDRVPVMIKKLQRRFFDKKSRITAAQYRQWLTVNAVPVNQWCEQKHPALWLETQDFIEDFFARYDREIRPQLPRGLVGGNACVRLLYFLTRLHKPETIVETGVALGFSSQAFLTALKRNGRGKLYSSDFPYFRLPDAEKYIGIVVEENLKRDWELHIHGDQKNLPAIMSKINHIDLFHYDSDKSYGGREYGLQAVQGKITPKTLFLFDDLQDNPHFHDVALSGKFNGWLVLENRGGYVGILNSALLG